MTAEIIYQGALRCEAKHLQSGTLILTDAPTDNRGKGEAFSPTDLLCVSLATCIITTIAIKADDLKLDIAETQMEVTKYMLAEPRRIGKIDINIQFPASAVTSEEDRVLLKKLGDNCPVAKTIHPDVEVNVEYNW